MHRRCTDAPCLLLFLGFLAGIAYIATIAAREGDVAKLTRGIDWRGRICGVDEGVRHAPLLFWCHPGHGEELRLLDGACVSSCPDGNGVKWCPGKATAYKINPLPSPSDSVRQIIVGGPELRLRNVTLKKDYKTLEALGYCFPTGNFLVQQLVEHTHVTGPTKQIFLAAHGAAKSWRFLLVIASSCVGLGYIFLFLLWVCFDKMVYIIAVVVHLLLLGCAVSAGYVGFHDEYNVFGHWFNMSTARLCACLCSVLTMALWVLFLLLHIYSREAIRSTVESVSATCEAIAQLPSLLLQPLLHSVFTTAALAALLYGFVWVLSTGRVLPSSSPVTQGGVTVAGMHRSLEFTAIEWLRVLYWAFGMVWILETMNALGQFAISYAVVSHRSLRSERTWRSCLPVLSGYFVGLVFHLGSLAFGGFVLGVLKILAAVLTFLSRQARDEAGVRGALSRVVCCCCAQCALVLEQALSMVNDLVYTDVALQGSRYVDAAENVVRVAASNPAEYALLKGSAGAVRVFGVLAITGASTLLAYGTLTFSTVKEFVHDRVSPSAASVLETSSLDGSVTAAAIICFQISMTFMTVFYQTTHTLTYCMLIGAATVGPKSPSSANSARKTLLLEAAGSV